MKFKNIYIVEALQSIMYTTATTIKDRCVDTPSCRVCCKEAPLTLKIKNSVTELYSYISNLHYNNATDKGTGPCLL